jgi:hypothetical protein
VTTFFISHRTELQVPYSGYLFAIVNEGKAECTVDSASSLYCYYVTNRNIFRGCLTAQTLKMSPQLKHSQGRYFGKDGKKLVQRWGIPE